MRRCVEFFKQLGQTDDRPERFLHHLTCLTRGDVAAVPLLLEHLNTALNN